MSSYIDTRDLYLELEELRAKRDLVQEVTEEGAELAEVEEWTEEDQERLTALEELEDEVGHEFMHGATLIPESEFQSYAQELAEDIGDVPRGGSDKWPYYCIDWEWAARELAQDYSIVTFEGQDYYVRL